MKIALFAVVGVTIAAARVSRRNRRDEALVGRRS